MGDMVVSLDCGTTTVKAAAFGLDGRRLGLAAVLCPPIADLGNRVEYAPDALVETAFGCIKKIIRESSLDPDRIAALSVTNQRASLVGVTRDGRAVGNIIGWQDGRARAEIEALRRNISDERYYRITGLPNHPVFSLGKILWMQRHDRERYRSSYRLVLIHDFLMRRLGCEDFFCDHANASLTGLLDIGRLKWSLDILEAAELDTSKLPTLVPPGQVIGAVSDEAASLTGLRAGTPLVAGGGDQQCAGLGAGALDPGMLEITLGTAAVPLCCCDRPVWDTARRITCCAHVVPGQWVLEGLQPSAGACLTWLWNLVGGDYETFVREVLHPVGTVAPGSDGLLFFPYLSGSGAPHWDASARGAFIGLTLSHQRPHIARAILEGITFETREIVDVFTALGVPIHEVRLTGGYTSLDAWNQIQADLLNRPVYTLCEPEATLLGAAMLAACGAGAFPSLHEAARQMVHSDRTYAPDPEGVQVYQDLGEQYRQAAESGWAAGLFHPHDRKE
jgi:xylulokinase